MPETQPGQGRMQEVRPEEKKDISKTQSNPRNDLHEPLWGALLLAFMLLFVIASIAGIGWVAYSKWQSERAAESRPSITTLLEQSNEEQKNDASPETSQVSESGTTEQADTDSIVAAKKLEISVLNGGGAKGSAGVLADFLKKEGYLKTDAGNTQKDYAGVIVYYAASLEKEAEIIKGSIVKKYPQAKILPADKANKETSVSQVTIILGE